MPDASCVGTVGRRQLHTNARRHGVCVPSMQHRPSNRPLYSSTAANLQHHHHCRKQRNETSSPPHLRVRRRRDVFFGWGLRPRRKPCPMRRPGLLLLLRDPLPRHPLGPQARQERSPPPAAQGCSRCPPVPYAPAATARPASARSRNGATAACTLIPPRPLLGVEVGRRMARCC